MRPDRERNRLVLIFLWKWKLSTTAALSAKFFVDMTPHGAYKRLRYLEVNGLIQSGRETFSDQVFWTLTKNGFMAIRNDIPMLKEEGFKSESIEHDLLVTGVHIGDTLLDQNSELEMFSEQQLRRYHPDSYPLWVPVTKLHRPDGYWYKTGSQPENKIVSLEVELSSKLDSDYFSLARHYARYPAIGRIIWVCGNERFSRRVLNLLQEGDEEAQNKHSFFLERDVIRLGWGASSICGADLGTSLRSILLSHPIKTDQESIGRTLGNDWESFPATLLFDYRKRRTNFETYFEWLKSQKLLLRPL